MKNKISLIIPNHNHAHYLPDCLDSALAQTRRADEIIIIDDASTDNSIEVIQSYQKIAPEIVLLRNEKNIGVNLTFNRGIEAARYNLISGIAADDIIFPRFYEIAADLFDRHPELGLICSDYAGFEDRKPYHYIPNKFGIADQITLFQPQEFVDLLKKRDFVIAPSTLYKKKLALMYGGFNPNLLSFSDSYLYTQIAFRHSIAYVPEIFGAARRVINSYGQSVRFALKKRFVMTSKLLQLVIEKEEPLFRNSYIRSGYLSNGGYFLILFIILTPKYWRYLPYITYKVLQRKFCARR